MKRSLLFLVLVGAALAQTESQIESDEVKRVGTHIACQCGSCTENINCNMSSGQCHFCKPARTKVYELQKAGMNDDGILAYFKKQYGEAIFRADPNSYFWLVPYLALLAGAGVFWMVISRMRASAKAAKPALASGVAQDDPVLARYREAAEKESESIE